VNLLQLAQGSQQHPVCLTRRTPADLWCVLLLLLLQNDVWSLGVVVAECLMGSHPYGDNVAASGAVMHSIASSQPLPISQLGVSAHCKDWLAAVLHGTRVSAGVRSGFCSMHG
jgi:hypothetical protein